MSIVLMGSTSGSVTLQEPAVAGSTVLNLPATTGTVALTLGQIGMKNRIINGAMTIDQRNAGASVTPANAQYTLDRWNSQLTQTGKYSVQQNAGSVTPPTGFTNYLGVTSLSAYSVGVNDIFNIFQNIEGFNIADLGWGTANAQTVTLSFWVRSSLTGTFGGSIQNDTVSRSYPFAFTINSANTWEQKSITIAGDTTGTWLTNNQVGIRVWFGLGVGSNYSATAGVWGAGDKRSVTGAVSVVGTNGATFYITGVQLELGSTATSFDYRPYGTELALCQRYYQTVSGLSGTTGASGGSLVYCSVQYPVQMRGTPTAGQTGVFAFENPFSTSSTQSSTSSTVISAATNNVSMYVFFNNFSGLPGSVPLNKFTNTNALTLSAEL